MTSVRRLVAAAGLTGLLLALPTVALAHPLGNFSINHHAGIRVSPDAVHVDLVIDMAEIPTVDAMREIDANGDGSATDTELDAAREPFCRDLAADVTLVVDGAPPSIELVAAGLHRRPGAGGLSVLRIVCELRAVPVGQISIGSRLAFSDGSYAGRIGWREIVIEGQDTSISGRLTRYPDDLLQRPLDERAVDVVVESLGPNAGWSASDAWPIDGPPPAIGGGTGSELPIGLDFARLDLPVVLFGLAAAALAGAGHAISPGHGKTVMAAYLVGSRGGARQAILLGAAVTLSHTIGVLALAAVVLFAGEIVAPEQLYPVLTVASGAAVIVIGAVLLAGCVRRLHDGRPHTHDHGHPHPHEHPHDHTHEPPVPGWRGLAALGIAGGLVPSTSALILLLAAIGAGQPAYGLALAASFGLGMAAVLSGIGLALVQGRGWLERIGTASPVVRRATAVLPWVTAIVVLVSGVAITGGSLVARL